MQTVPKMSKLTYLILYAWLIISIQSLLYVPQPGKRLKLTLRSNDDHTSNTDRWVNSNFDAKETNKWFCDLKKSLLTIGTQGVRESHINSLQDLLKSHARVRIKLASDRISSKEIAAIFINHPTLIEKIILIEVRSREFMVGRA